MKIAIIGNMNNNGFALMRYFRDLGEDAQLLLYSNDGVGALSQFDVDADTWNICKWRRYIHRIDIENSLTSVHHPFVLWFLRNTRRLWQCKNSDGSFGYMPISNSQVSQRLKGFDFIICSGIAPAVLYKLALTPDIYYPYSTGVEYIGHIGIMMDMSFIKRCYVNFGKIMQIAGLRKTRFILNSEFSITAEVLKKYNIPFIPLAVPMVYNLESEKVEEYTSGLREIISIFNKHDFIIFSHARNFWLKPRGIDHANWFESKNTDWLIRAFAAFLHKRPSFNSKLVLLEYGPDVAASKDLIENLGITSHVIWLRKMPRKHLLVLLRYATIGVGEFRTQENILWGGTGWEVLAVGKPLLQSLNFKGRQFNELLGYPPPPMLPVTKEGDILPHLLDMADHPEKREAIGRGAKEWFNRNNGIGLAKRWLDLLMTPLEDEVDSAGAPAGHGANV